MPVVRLRRFRSLIVFAPLILLWSCDAPVHIGQGEPATISLEPERITLSVGDTARLIATVRNPDAAGDRLSFATLEPTIATVSASGLVTALRVGNARIVAMWTGRTTIADSSDVVIIP